MLKQVFSSDNADFKTFTPDSIVGLFVQSVQTPTSNECIYLYCHVHNYPDLGSEGVIMSRFDAQAGTYLDEIDAPVGVFVANLAFQSRLGNLYYYTNSVFGSSSATQFSVSNLSTNGRVLCSTSEFGLSSTYGWACLGYDETTDTFINGVSNNLLIYQFSTRTLQYIFTMPDNVKAICMAEANCAYILCNNGVLLLINYVTGQVLSAVLMPPSPGGGSWASSSLAMVWYSAYSRLLVAVLGTSANVVGYRMVPIPTRLTKPQLLDSPILGSTVQVMTQIVGDLNEGLGGAYLTSVVTGGGKKLGGSSTDNFGRTMIPIECISSADVAVNCSVTIPDVT